MTLFEVNLASLAYLFVYIVINFPSNYILDRYGIKTGLIIGTLFTIASVWTRSLINFGFYWVIIG